MNYKKVFSITYFNMPVIVYLLLLLITVFVLALIFTKRLGLSTKIIRGIITALIFITIFEIFCIGTHDINAYSLYNENYSLLEGQVEKFIPFNQNPKGIESFEVKGIKFRYSSASINGGLNHSISDSINNGTNVKIYYKNDVILRIEVEEF